jgi:hypothetical protein
MLHFIGILCYSIVILFCWIVSTSLTINYEIDYETRILRSVHFFLAIICSIGIGFLLN